MKNILGTIALVSWLALAWNAQTEAIVGLFNEWHTIGLEVGWWQRIHFSKELWVTLWWVAGISPDHVGIWPYISLNVKHVWFELASLLDLKGWVEWFKVWINTEHDWMTVWAWLNIGSEDKWLEVDWIYVNVGFNLFGKHEGN